MGFGTELLLAFLLGFLILGPKRLYAMLGNLAQAKAEFEKASHGFKSQLMAGLESPPHHVQNEDESGRPRQSAGAENSRPDSLAAPTLVAANVAAEEQA